MRAHAHPRQQPPRDHAVEEVVRLAVRVCVCVCERRPVAALLCPGPRRRRRSPSVRAVMPSYVHTAPGRTTGAHLRPARRPRPRPRAAALAGRRPTAPYTDPISNPEVPPGRAVHEAALLCAREAIPPRPMPPRLANSGAAAARAPRALPHACCGPRYPL